LCGSLTTPRRALQAQPNAAHQALSAFSIAAQRRAVAPDSTFTLITQNVDGLSKRALDATIDSLPPAEAEAARAQEADANHPAMLEMHGRLFDVQCTRCKHSELDFSSPVCTGLAGTEELMDAGVVEPDVTLADLPRCRKCGELARPGVVWFGERPKFLPKIDRLVEEADLCIVVGTSSTVRRFPYTCAPC
jgi:NAD-dependent deacetylase sirtuin 5